MRTIRILFISLLFCSIQSLNSQVDLSKFKDIEGVKVVAYWGNIQVFGSNTSDKNHLSIEGTHTDTSKVKKTITDLQSFVEIRQQGSFLIIECREPIGFESIDLKVYVPKYLYVELLLKKGGEIYARDLEGGLEINSYNGSVEINGIENYALVNAANGEIKAGFTKLNKTKPSSLVTMNGGVTVSLKNEIKRDIRLISRKNGYILSDFELESKDLITSLNKRQYSKTPIVHSAKINGGGALLFLSTENGPITLKKLF